VAGESLSPDLRQEIFRPNKVAGPGFNASPFKGILTKFSRRLQQLGDEQPEREVEGERAASGPRASITVAVNQDFIFTLCRCDRAKMKNSTSSQSPSCPERWARVLMLGTDELPMSSHSARILSHLLPLKAALPVKFEAAVLCPNIGGWSGRRHSGVPFLAHA
jgi:hypothetical protein